MATPRADRLVSRLKFTAWLHVPLALLAGWNTFALFGTRHNAVKVPVPGEPGMLMWTTLRTFDLAALWYAVPAATFLLGCGATYAVLARAVARSTPAAPVVAAALSIAMTLAWGLVLLTLFVFTTAMTYASLSWWEKSLPVVLFAAGVAMVPWLVYVTFVAFDASRRPRARRR